VKDSVENYNQALVQPGISKTQRISITGKLFKANAKLIVENKGVAALDKMLNYSSNELKEHRLDLKRVVRALPLKYKKHLPNLKALRKINVGMKKVAKKLEAELTLLENKLDYKDEMNAGSVSLKRIKADIVEVNTELTELNAKLESQQKEYQQLMGDTQNNTIASLKRKRQISKKLTSQLSHSLASGTLLARSLASTTLQRELLERDFKRTHKELQLNIIEFLE
jgi:hypothetical protein